MAPSKPFREAALICGRRAGKSRILGFIAATLALRDYRQFLGAGEIATVSILASDRKQSRAIFNFVRGFLGEFAADRGHGARRKHRGY